VGGWAVPGGGGGRDDYSWESVRCPDRYYSSNITGNESLGGFVTVVKDIGWAMPFLVPCQQSFDRIGIMVATAKPNSEVRVGIYEDDGQCYPANLVVDSGVLFTNTIGLKEANIDELLDAGLYWLGFVGTNDGVNKQNIRALYRIYMSPQLGWPSPPASYPAQNYQKNPMAYGALPNPFPAGATIMSSANMLAIFLRKKNAVP